MSYSDYVTPDDFYIVFQYIYKLKKKCFIICPIGPKDSDIRKRSDQIFKYVINPAAESCGYEVIRGDHIDSPGMITSQVIQHLMEDESYYCRLDGKKSKCIL